MIAHGSKNKEELNYSLIQSCIFGLGIISQRVPNGQFTQLQQTINVIAEIAKAIEVERPDMDEEEKESMLMMADNSKSTLAKIICFQYDGGNVVKDEYTV